MLGYAFRAGVRHFARCPRLKIAVWSLVWEVWEVIVWAGPGHALDMCSSSCTHHVWKCTRPSRAQSGTPHPTLNMAAPLLLHTPLKDFILFVFLPENMENDTHHQSTSLLNVFTRLRFHISFHSYNYCQHRFVTLTHLTHQLLRPYYLLVYFTNFLHWVGWDEWSLVWGLLV